MVSNELILKFEHKIESKNMKFSRGSNDEIETLSNETCRAVHTGRRKDSQAKSSRLFTLFSSLSSIWMGLYSSILGATKKNV